MAERPSVTTVNCGTSALDVPATASSPYRGPYVTAFVTMTATFGPGISTSATEAMTKAK